MCSGAACSKCCTESFAQKCSNWNETTGGSYNRLTQQCQIRIESRAASQSPSLSIIEVCGILMVSHSSRGFNGDHDQPPTTLSFARTPMGSHFLITHIAIDPGEIKPAFLWNSIRIYSQRSVGPKQSYLPGRCCPPKGSHSQKFLYKNGIKRTHLGWFWIWKPP